MYRLVDFRALPREGRIGFGYTMELDQADRFTRLDDTDDLAVGAQALVAFSAPRGPTNPMDPPTIELTPKPLPDFN